ncbi:MAG: CAP domain-containing protein [Luteolibacter sp.]
MKFLAALGTASMRLAVLFCLAVFCTASAEVHLLKSSEFRLFNAIADDPGQMRLTLSLDPILCKVARQRAADMARRDYFSHINPDGLGPNYLVRRAGYTLPVFYDSSKTGNNIESILLTTSSPKKALEEWKRSQSHKVHLLGIDLFYQVQTSIGVGVFPSGRKDNLNYYVFLSAPKNTNLIPPLVILKDPQGKIIAGTR